MASTQTHIHMVVIPYPGRGHINPMLDICRAIAEKSRDIIMTVIVTEEWLGLIDDKPRNISFATIPNVLPSERVRGDDPQGFWAAVWKDMEEPVDRLIQLQPDQPAIVIADAVLPWAANVASRRNIPLASVWPMSPSIFTIHYHFDLLVANGHFPINLPVNGDAIVDYIPGLPPSRLADISKTIRKQEDVNIVLQLIPKAKFLIFTTIYELEFNVINALKQNSLYSIYNIGPYASYSKLKHNKSDRSVSDGYYLKWLDAQPPNSVLYISLGSYLSVSTAQMDEMSIGILASDVHYLWVARGETHRLQDILQEGKNNKGLVVEWCDQLRVLSHPSVGGFLSHCGWNSTKEALMSGVPLLTFPIIIDQVHNAKAIVEDWKVGWKVKREFDEQDLAGSDEIAEIVKKFMDLENDERKELTRNATDLQKICEGEFAQGQSFECNVDGFVKSILQLGSLEF